jgi:hypothetical protein
VTRPPTNAAVRNALRRLEAICLSGNPERLAERVSDVRETLAVTEEVIRWLAEYSSTLRRRGGLR